MQFGEFLGNSHIKAALSSAASQDRFSHFYLISGPEGSGRHTLARVLAAAMLCTGEGERPCGACRACRKLRSGSHPDFITVDDPEKKTVPVELVRWAREDMFIRPNEGKRKIYLFPRAQNLGLPGQNALLKVLEEPPAYGVFLLLADNPERLLTTVRSRCTELKLQPLEPEILLPALQARYPDKDGQALNEAIARSQGYLGAAMKILEGAGKLPQTARFAAAYGAKDTIQLLELLTSMEKSKRESLIEIFAQWRELLVEALQVRSGRKAVEPEAAAISAVRTAKELRSGAEALAQAISLVQGNVSPGAVCGNLVWKLQ